MLRWFYPPVRPLCLLGLVAVLATGGAGCIDIRDFGGKWAGGVVSEPAVRQGFSTDVRVDPLELSNVDFEGLTARLTTTDGKFNGTVLTKVVKFSNDTIASLTFDGSPLRSYMLFAPLHSETTGWPAMMVVSLFADDRVELRVLRGNDLFGVFNLQRQPE